MSIDVQLYMTGVSSSMQALDSTRSSSRATSDDQEKCMDDEDDEKPHTSALLSHANVGLVKGRPNLYQMLDEETSLAAGPVSVAGTSLF